VTEKKVRLPTPGNWHRKAFFGLHYDLHATANDTELGAGLTHEHLRNVLQRIRPDWVQCDCKGHPGYTSWPTQVGATAPGVVQDMLRIYRDVTAELDIPLGMHYSGVIDNRAIELHPDWAVIDAEGKPNPRSTCRNSPYVTELMIPQLIEIIDRYDVDGFWVDGDNWGSNPCWCPRCKAEFTRHTGLTTVPSTPDDPGWRAWLDFHRELFTAYVTLYVNAVHTRKPTCMVCSNWMYTLRQPESIQAPVDYLSGDYTPNWGADRAAIEGRFIDSRGMSWDLMAWGFTRGWDGTKYGPHIMKPAVHLCQELAGVVALGGGVMVYTQPARTGHLSGWQHDILADVAHFCRERKHACFGSQTASEVAILHLSETLYDRNNSLYNLGGAQAGIEGALHIMQETGHTVDILCRDTALQGLDRYKLVILPEPSCIGPDIMAELRRYTNQGGCVLITGSALSEKLSDFVGAVPAGDAIDGDVGMAFGGRSAMVLTGWRPVAALHGASVLRRRLRRDDPAGGETDDALVTLNRFGLGQVLAAHGPLFESYAMAHTPYVRALVADLVSSLSIDWEIVVDGPPWLEVIARSQDGGLVINLINRGSANTLSPNQPIVESIAPIGPMTIKVRLAKAPGDVRAIPASPINWNWSNGMVTVRLDSIHIHTAIVIGQE